MAISLAQVSRRLEMPPEELMEKSLRSYIAREIRLAEWDISDIKERYNTASRAELEDTIKAQKIHGHPAWEDLIHWENLEEYIARLRTVEEEVKVVA